MKDRKPRRGKSLMDSIESTKKLTMNSEDPVLGVIAGMNSVLEGFFKLPHDRSEMNKRVAELRKNIPEGQEFLDNGTNEAMINLAKGFAGLFEGYYGKNRGFVDTMRTVVDSSPWDMSADKSTEQEKKVQSDETWNVVGTNFSSGLNRNCGESSAAVCGESVKQKKKKRRNKKRKPKVEDSEEKGEPIYGCLENGQPCITGYKQYREMPAPKLVEEAVHFHSIVDPESYPHPCGIWLSKPTFKAMQRKKAEMRKLKGGDSDSEDIGEWSDSSKIEE